jgi:glycosyltransferase involved in cell wall biosynthesis
LSLFSIITPSYNQAAYLEQTLRSVLEQDYPALEYIVVDGASSDGSVEIIRRYGPRLAWWVSEPDHGQAEAINKGFTRASSAGEYIAWLNSDDLYLPGTLRAVAEAFEQHPEVGLVFGDVASINAAGETFNVMAFGPRSLDDLLCFNIISQPGVFLRRSILERAGLLDPSYHYLLDHQLWLRAACLAPTLYLPRRLAAARFHAEAKNVAQSAAFGREAYRIIEWVKSQPDLQDTYRRLRRRIWSGAYRFDARYLQDGGQPRAALAAYLRSLAAHPPTALPEWRRMLYAAASLFANPERLKQRYLAARKNRLDRS